MYPGYNFGPLMQQGQMGQMPQMGGQPMLGQGLLSSPTDPTAQQQGGSHHHGMNPLMMLSPLLAMFASGHPNIGLGMISPSLGIASALGAFK